MKVIKRDGRAVEYNSEKIYTAIEKANKEVIDAKRATTAEIGKIVDYIESLDKKRILVEDIQDIIEQKLMELGRYELAKKYIVYRYTRALVRKQNTTDESILRLIKNNGNVSENSEKNSVIASIQRNLIAGEVSKDLTKRILLPEKITKAHEEGILHFHAMEFFLQPIINSCIVNIKDMIDNGTVINNQKYEEPKGFLEACDTFTQIISEIAISQYGKQYIKIAHLGKYLKKSYDNIKSEIEKTVSLDKDTVEKITKKMVENELLEGIENIKRKINCLKNVYEGNCSVVFILQNDEADEFYEENNKIIKCILKQDIENCEIICNENEFQNYQYDGHFNYGVVTINLPQISLSIDNDEEKFWKLLDERLEICYEALMCRHYALLGVISDTSPIHWQNGAIARLASGDKIDKLLKDGYSNMSLGYVGMTESTKILSSKFQWDTDMELDFKNRLDKYLEDKIKSWKKMTGIGFNVEKITKTEANSRLYEIDKGKFGKTLEIINQESY